MSDIDLHAIKRRYGGDISGNTVKIPTPRHSRKDRGTSITLAPDAPDGCLVHCFNDYDPLAIKDMLRRDGFRHRESKADHIRHCRTSMWKLLCAMPNRLQRLPMTGRTKCAGTTPIRKATFFIARSG